MEKLPGALKPGGRVAILTFHSGEDRLVKQGLKEGYIEAGRQLKEKSNGEVYLSYIDPTSKTWRYWGRRGLMPSAGAKIWDENGEVVIGSDEGTKKALGALDTMNTEGLLLKTTIIPPGKA